MIECSLAADSQSAARRAGLSSSQNAILVCVFGFLSQITYIGELESAPMEAIPTFGVLPVDQEEYCLDRKSVRRTLGVTYFSEAPCFAQSAAKVRKYRVRCQQNPGGPFNYDRQIEGRWINYTAQRGDALGSLIVQVCAFPPIRTPPVAPPP